MVRQPWPDGKPAGTAVTLACCSNADSIDKGTPRGSAAFGHQAQSCSALASRCAGPHQPLPPARIVLTDVLRETAAAVCLEAIEALQIADLPSEGRGREFESRRPARRSGVFAFATDTP